MVGILETPGLRHVLASMSAEFTKIKLEDLIAVQDVVITVSHSGYLKRTPLVAYRQQLRGGKDNDPRFGKPDRGLRKRADAGGKRPGAVLERFR